MSWRDWSATELAVAIGVGGSVLAVAVPAFVRNLSASKLSEPIESLDRVVRGALSYAETHSQELSFPPSAPLTPAEVPRGVLAEAEPDAWEHLTWRSLRFRMDRPHAFSYRFDSHYDPATKVSRFVATAHGDLDGDGSLSTFQVRGERQEGAAALVLPGMYVDREVE